MQKTEKSKEEKIKELFRLGAHFGFSRSRRHPSVNSFIFGFKNKTAIIDLEKALESLEKAKELVGRLGAEGKQILFVGNKNEARAIIQKYASVINMPYVAERWIGGTFTNFKQIRTRVEKLKDYQEKEKTGDLAMYTKKERGLMALEKEKMEKIFSGIENMEKLPAAMIVVDVKEEAIAVQEARKAKIPVVSLSSSDCDIRGIDYPIIANDYARTSIEFFISELVEAYRAGKTSAQSAPKEKAEATA